MTLQSCQNVSYWWNNTIIVKNITEGLEPPYTVYECDYKKGCTCAIEEITPEKARGMLFDTVYIYDTHTVLELRHKEVV
jgi:hypothetical protein